MCHWLVIRSSDLFLGLFTARLATGMKFVQKGGIFHGEWNKKVYSNKKKEEESTFWLRIYFLFLCLFWH